MAGGEANQRFGKGLLEEEAGGRTGAGAQRASLAEWQLASAFSMAWAKSAVRVSIRKIADPQHQILPTGLAELCYKCVVYQGKSILGCQKIVGVALIMF